MSRPKVGNVLTCQASTGFPRLRKRREKQEQTKKKIKIKKKKKIRRKKETLLSTFGRISTKKEEEIVREGTKICSIRRNGP